MNNVLSPLLVGITGMKNMIFYKDTHFQACISKYPHLCIYLAKGPWYDKKYSNTKCMYSHM